MLGDHHDHHPRPREGDNLFAVFIAEYTDAPSDPGTPAQTGTAEVILYPAAATAG
ncbi:hypothetical protein [Phytohabitans houttuyneae]|uniref:Uncharacterized protein n=1 Tax=Phytohabitans houttuyneae TaxID=1076126 RepID=A0A6V8KJU0_9ACTN|nr:hypothetical protein [Phytohabitans houttuyneae]GFJ82691.1 hypothetical protein Phou_068710 [Phytohabitans houttuyneae]